MRSLQAAHAGHQMMIVGNRAPAHQRRNDRHAGDFGKLNEYVTRIGVNDDAADDPELTVATVRFSAVQSNH